MQSSFYFNMLILKRELTESNVVKHSVEQESRQAFENERKVVIGIATFDLIGLLQTNKIIATLARTVYQSL